MYVLQMSPIAGIILLLHILRLTKLALVCPLEIVLMQKFFRLPIMLHSYV